jgi:hypothetical protein
MHEQKGITQLIPTYPGISLRGQVGITQDKGGYPYLSRVIPSYPGMGYPSITWDKFEDPIYFGISRDNFFFESYPKLKKDNPKVGISQDIPG